jgi:hypothetical protein
MIFLYQSLLVRDSLTPYNATPFWLTPSIPFGGVTMDHIAISPESFVQKCRTLLRASNLYLVVKDGNVRLSRINSACKTESIDRVEAIRFGITYEMLLNALSEAGGNTK